MYTTTMNMIIEDTSSGEPIELNKGDTVNIISTSDRLEVHIPNVGSIGYITTYYGFEKVQTAMNFLDNANKHMKQRASQYDSKSGERSALATATAFNAITGHDITEAEVYLLLQILKDVRQWRTGTIPHMDSLEDCVAYAALKAEALCRMGN